ncbi:MAG: EAL domain-containing protein, partial [Magnetococcales bacterium]|nr:EAL domain-containing protein [Magnetococcales bacterium]
GRHCHPLFHPGNTTTKECPVCLNLSSSKPIFGIDLKFPSRNLYHQITLTPMQALGAPGGIIHACSDITQRKLAERALRTHRDLLDELVKIRTQALDKSNQAMQKYASIVSVCQDHLSYLNRDYTYLAVNDAYLSTSGKSRHEIEGHTVAELLGDEIFQNEVKPKLDRCLEGAHVNYQAWFDFGTGNQRLMDVSYHPFRLEDGSITGVVVASRDITKRERAAHDLALSEQRYQSLFDTMTSGVAVYETFDDGTTFTIRDFNKAAERINKAPREEVLGRSISEVFPGVHKFGLFDVFQRVYQSGKAEHFPITFYEDDRIQGWRDNYVYKLSEREIVAIHDDVTEQKQLEMELKKKAEYDDLTGLPNRTLFRDRLEQAISLANRYKNSVALMFIDLDRFKQINDTMGHDAGDQLLVEASRRISGCVRESDTVARLGGDEFTVVLPAQIHPNYVELVARKILEQLAAPFLIQEENHFISGSIGITLYPEDGDNLEEILKNADSAMYQAKAAGRNAFKFFTTEMNDSALVRMKLENDLREALENQAFSVHYQPKVSLTTGQLMGMEALVRWEREEGEMVYPDQFIGIAEETGLIEPLGAWVLETACQEAKAWFDNDIRPMRVAVNLSARQLQQKHFIETVRGALETSGLPPAFLELEITESMMQENLQQTIATLLKLEQMGVHIAMDDFGTGYSSLSQLKRLPIHTLKIDKSFVRDITQNSEDAAIITAIISMAKALQLEVVAEGVEDEEQLAFLRQNACCAMQGYFFSRPLHRDDFHQFLTSRKSLD